MKLQYQKITSGKPPDNLFKCGFNEMGLRIIGIPKRGLKLFFTLIFEVSD